MSLKIVLSSLTLILLVSAVNAFPLSGSNREANATIFGVIDDGAGTVYIDIGSDHTLGDVALVDSDDKFYHAEIPMGNSPYLSYVVGVSCCHSTRGIYSINVPTNTEIKRVRITPLKYTEQQLEAMKDGVIPSGIDPSSNPQISDVKRITGDPFSIEWTGVPEVKDASLYLKFYGIRALDDYSIKAPLKGWTMDVKVTNNGTQKRMISNDQFEVVDQFGFHYKGPGYVNSGMATVEPVDLMPGESVRFDVRIGWVSPLSRPIYLTYMPLNLTMDIGAWA